VVLVDFPPVVLAEEDLDGVGPGVGVDEVDGVVDGAVRETL